MYSYNVLKNCFPRDLKNSSFNLLFYQLKYMKYRNVRKCRNSTVCFDIVIRVYILHPLEDAFSDQNLFFECFMFQCMTLF